MAIKPTEIPQWATDGTNNDEPALGQKQTGWTPGQIPTSDAFNWWQHTVYLWTSWLDAVTVEFGTNSVTAENFAASTSLFGVTVNTNNLTDNGDGDIDVAVPIVMAADQTITLSGTATVFTPTVSTDDIVSNGAASIGIDTDVVMAVDQNITLSGTGDYKHGDRVLSISPAAGQVETQKAATDATWRYTPTASGVQNWQGHAGIATVEFVSFPINLLVGDRISTVEAIIHDTGGGNTVTLTLMQTNSAGSTVVGVTDTSAGDGTTQTLLAGNNPVTVAAGDFYTAVVKNDTSASTTAHVIFGLNVLYDRP